MDHLTDEIIKDCRDRLLSTKSELLNRLKEIKREYDSNDFGGDEADQSMSVLAENEFLANQNRIRHQLVEVESALARIEQGRYGICEETEEFIETERLKAIPWTRLSIEGAEVREAMEKRFAR